MLKFHIRTARWHNSLRDGINTYSACMQPRSQTPPSFPSLAVRKSDEKLGGAWEEASLHVLWQQCVMIYFHEYCHSNEGNNISVSVSRAFHVYQYSLVYKMQDTMWQLFEVCCFYKVHISIYIHSNTKISLLATCHTEYIYSEYYNSCTVEKEYFIVHS